VGCVVVAAPVGQADAVRAALVADVPAGLDLRVVEGGETRQDSVACALAAVPPGYPIILVHDAARALAPPDLVERVAAAVRDGHDAVIPVLPVVDTIKRVDESGHVSATIDRSTLRAVQTPQGFRREVLEAAHRSARQPHRRRRPGGADGGPGVLRARGRGRHEDHPPGDLATAERLLRASSSDACGAESGSNA
jgi:2-C-methyl-D-erythritol 4-phosphate cytidylyltransferase